MTAAGLQRLAAGVLCVGFEGATTGDAPLCDLAALAPGGLVLFARNAGTLEETRTLVDAARDAIVRSGGEAPLVAVDQEGGRVRRLRRGAHDVPPMMALGAANDEALAERVGGVLAADARAAGASVVFAPVVDLAREPAGTVIGERALGDDPECAARLGSALARGIQAQGLAATLKHFPGHGATAGDSHDLLPIVDAAIQDLRSRDLVPFVAGIQAGARAVMTAHVVFSALDPDQPATLSKRILTTLLRDELGFAGACFTDCAEMQAVSGLGSERIAVRALLAGADCVVLSHHLELAVRARDAIVSAVEFGELPLERLKEAAQRVRALARVAPATTPVDGDAGSEAARRAITLLRSPGNRTFPLRAPVTVVSFEGATVEGAQGAHADHASLALALRERRIHAELFRAPLEPSAEMTEQLVALVRAQGEREVVMLSRRAYVHSSQRAALRALLAAAPDAVLVAMREPFDVAEFPQARTVLCAFGDGEVSIAALAAVLSGRAVAGGRLPVALPAALA